MPSFGYFDKDSDEYVITDPETARPQENVLFNDSYFAFTHQTGNGFSRHTDADGYATTILAGTNEPAYNTNSRLVYIRDDRTGEFWSVGYFPVCRPPRAYQCRHGAGYTVVSNTTNGICATWRLFVPRSKDPVEIWTLTLVNKTRRARKLSVFAFGELSLETSYPTYGSASYLNSMLLARSFGVAARKVSMNRPNPFSAAVLISNRKPTSMDADMNAFMQQFRTLAHPRAVEIGRCSGAVASRDRVAGVLHHRLTLSPLRPWRCDYIAGAADADRIEPDAAAYTRKYLARPESVESAFERMRAQIKRTLGRVVVDMRDYKLNVLFNQWIPLLIEWGATSGRWGMLGYRDILQQARGYMMFGCREKVVRRLTQALTHQYASGHAVRSFPAVHEDSTMRYADSSRWLVGAVTEYLKETADAGFLEKRVAFLDGGRATVLEHLARAMDVLWKDRGRHGLCLIHQGDWNDSLTHVGPAGRGESVWLSQAFCVACLEMAELYEYLGQKASAAACRRRYESMKQALNRHCWDGAWYIRAFDDDGNAIGSKVNRQGRIFLNTQSWALLSRTAPPRRAEAMLKSIRKHLWTPYGYALLAPAYTVRQDNIGRLTCLEPGCSENGSVYTHGNAFLAVALLKAGLADEGFDVVRRIMPFNPANPSKSVIPYQLANGYGGPAHRNDPGKAQFGWSTGSGAWLHQAVVEYMFGLRRTYDGLLVRPSLPSAWKKAAVRRVYRDTTYRVSFRRRGSGNEVRLLTVDGRKHSRSRPLPIRPGRTVNVEVLLGRVRSE